MALVDFLKTDHSKEELDSALKVLRSFKKCESQEEWLSIPFAAWTKVEQFEEYLAHLVEGKDLEEDTKQELAAGNAEGES